MMPLGVTRSARDASLIAIAHQSIQILLLPLNVPRKREETGSREITSPQRISLSLTGEQNPKRKSRRKTWKDGTECRVLMSPVSLNKF